MNDKPATTIESPPLALKYANEKRGCRECWNTFHHQDACSLNKGLRGFASSPVLDSERVAPPLSPETEPRCADCCGHNEPGNVFGANEVACVALVDNGHRVCGHRCSFPAEPASEGSVEEDARNTPWPECPITRRPFFMNMDHPEMGEVPTFGGPFDSYTIPRVDDDGDLRCERYDHDAGDWFEGGEPLGVWLTTEQPCNHDLPTFLARHREPETACEHHAAAPPHAIILQSLRGEE